MFQQKYKLVFSILLSFVIAFSFFALHHAQAQCILTGSTGCNTLPCCTADCFTTYDICCDSNASCDCCEADKNNNNIVDIADLSICSLNYTGCALYECISCTGVHLNEICSGCEGGGDPPPLQIECALVASPLSGTPPFNVNFTANITNLNGLIFNSWQLNYNDGNNQCAPGDCFGSPDSNIYPHTYDTSGLFRAMLGFYDASGILVGGCSSSEIISLGSPQNLRHTSNTTGFINWGWDADSGVNVYYRVYTRGIGLLTGIIDSFFTEFWNSPALTNRYVQNSYLEGGLGYLLSSFIFNVKNIIGVSTCLGTWMGPGPSDPCSAILEARVATSIETPNIITCAPTNNSLTVQVNSNERTLSPGAGGFSYFDTTNWGVNNNSKVYAKVELSGSPITNTSWNINPPGGTFAQRAAPFVVPTPWLVSGLSPATTYSVCARSANQDNQLNTFGDYRPGPNSSDWFCVNCATTGAPPPVSLGYLKLYHQGLGTIKLNLIKASDALLKSPFPGMVKVAMFNGDTNTAADLVAVTDPMASPVRIYTGLGGGNGIWSWKKLP